MTTKELLTTQQLADVLQVTPRHIWELQKKKRIPSLRLDRVIRYELEDVIEEMKKSVSVED